MSRIYVFSTLIEFVVAAFWSCWAAALIGAGYPMPSLAMLLASFYIAQTIFEIPTGYFADKKGRKLSTLLGIVSLAVGFLMLGLVRDKALATAGFFLAGIGLTLNSGARTSWLLGLAAAKGHASNAEQRESFFLTTNLLGRFATILGAFGGVALLKRSPEGFWIAAFVVSLATLAYGAFALASDRAKGTAEIEKVSFAEIRESLKYAPYALAVASILFFGIETGIRNLVNQPYVLELSRGNADYLAYFQAILAAVRILGIVFYRSLSASTKAKVGRRFLVFPLFLFAGAELFASVAGSFWSFLLVYGAAVFALGWHFPLRDAFINSLVPEKLRATLLSLDSMVMNLGSAVVLLALSGTPFDLRGLWQTGGLMLVLSAVALRMSAYKRSHSP
jgi:MFS family permease